MILKYDFRFSLWMIVSILILTIISYCFYQSRVKSIYQSKSTAISFIDGSKIHIFSISNDYYFKVNGKNGITIHIEYPSMLPNHPSYSFSMDKAIRIHMTNLVVSGSDEIIKFLQHVESSYCKKSIDCYYRLISENQQYQYYQSVDHGRGVVTEKYLLFKSYDGQLILLEDSGEWSSSYRVRRNVAGYISLDYQFPKKLVKNTETEKKISEDFIAIDNSVTEFIKSRLKTKL